MEHGKVQVLKEKFSLTTCISDAVKLFTHEAARKHIEMVISYPDHEQGDGNQVSENKMVPELAYTDPARLQQILLNLLSNAVKFTPFGGKVTVVITNERIDIQVPYLALTKPSPLLCI